MSILGGWCFRHRRIVVGVWLLALVLSALLSRVAGTAFSTKFTLPHTESSSAIALLQKNFPVASGSSDQVVFATTSGTVRDPAVQQRAKSALRAIAAVHDVRTVTSPFTSAGAHQISADGTVAYATVGFARQVGQNPIASIKKVISTAQAAGDDQLQVSLGGQDIEQVQQSGSGPSTGVGIVLALIVLGLAFGALFAAFLPLVTALVAIGIGYSVTGLLSHVFSVAEFATILGVLIGLGVGVDYSLFIVTRHRNALKAGRTAEEAASLAVNTAGRAVFFAGLTVCIALLGQFALGLSFLYGVAVSATVTVLLTMLASLTLLPALLGFVDSRVLSRRERRRLRERGPQDEELGTAWFRWSRFLQRHPVLPAVVAVVVVAVIALPVFSLRLGLDDAGSDPSGSTTREAYDALAEGFGPGFSGPLQLVAELQTPADAKSFAGIVQTLSTQPGVVSATTPVPSPNGRIAVANLYPRTSPQAQATTDLVNHLRSDVLPGAEAGTGVHVLVGGSTAGQVDFAHKLSSKLIPFVAVVVVLGFLLLMAVFRSLLVPLVASVMNLLSVGAALGIMNAVFVWGYGHSLFRISSTAPVEVFIPVLMISILFGLSMDYEVFLVSRIHEEWTRRRNNADAVTYGQAETGRVITAAAMIMILVFASFALGDDLTIKQFGIGLAGAIIIDAFVVRTVIVPALMHLFGRANWWLPRWLERALPQLNVEGADPARDDTPPAELVGSRRS
ncbi:MMPL family transporter [Jatrophihabitans endophyticus]|uniref:MMPL family transporter n=1 Tax=Jatrophihabitans endophyticus TaxID=1206085 RepID=UPI001A0BDAA4|nr:MMPL family transporter [Jatrophihabitans endophyticus]MBE7188380.1 MMPL family transporter [Jatrophihabitans endophyticus]